MPLPEHVQEQRNVLVEKVIKDIEAGKPFFWDSEHFGRPAHNIALGSSYRGLNRMRLMIAAEDKGFTDSRWCTYKQAQDKGWKVKKGEKGTHIEFWSKSITVKELNPETGEEEKKLKDLDCPIVKYYTVFNAQQMEGVPTEHSLSIDENEKNKYMENMLKNSEAKIFFDQSNRNFYSPTTDEIHVLPREKFKTMDGFYATCAHEIAHSTGHSTRMNRDMLNFEKSEYAKEELRAELASTFLQQQYGIQFDEKHYENHAAYLQSWAIDIDGNINSNNQIFSSVKEYASKNGADEFAAPLTSQLFFKTSHLRYDYVQNPLYTEEQINKLVENPKILFHAMKKAQEIVKSMQMSQERELKNMADKIQNEWNQPFKDLSVDFFWSERCLKDLQGKGYQNGQHL